MRGVYSEVPVGRSARAAGETIRPWQSPAHGSKHGKDSNESKPGEDQHKRHFSVIKRCSDEGNKRRLQTPSCRHLGSTQKKKHMQGFQNPGPLLAPGRTQGQPANITKKVFDWSTQYSAELAPSVRCANTSGPAKSFPQDIK